MIKNNQKEALKALGIDIDALIAAHSDTKEVDIEIPEGRVYTESQLTERDGNKVKEGEAIAIGVLQKEMKSQLNIDWKGERIGKAVEAMNKAISELSGDSKVKQLSEQVTLLQNDKDLLIKEVDIAKGIADKTRFEYDQYGKLPKNRKGDFTEGEYLSLLEKRGIEIKSDGVYKAGKPIVDETTRSTLPHDKAYDRLFREFNWVSDAGGSTGRGGSNSGAGTTKPMNRAEANEVWKAQNPDKDFVTNSSSVAAYYIECAKDNPTFFQGSI